MSDEHGARLREAVLPAARLDCGHAKCMNERNRQFDAALDRLLRHTAAQARVEGDVCPWQHGRQCEERKPHEPPCPWCQAKADLAAIEAERG